MKLEKAIEIKEANREPSTPEELQLWEEADKLGIEALKDKLRARKYGLPSSAILLPGETEDG